VIITGLFNIVFNFINFRNFSVIGVCFAILTGGSPAGKAEDTMEPKAVLQAFQAGDTTRALAAGLNSLTEKGSSFSEEWSWLSEEWFHTFVPTAEIELEFSDDLKPVGTALVLVPLFERAESGDILFTQGSISRFDGRTTSNFGIGYRRPVLDNKLLLGVNSFYDYEWPYNHSRASVGGEIRTTVGEVNFNQYWGISGWKAVSNGFEERALDGYDVELGLSLPYMPRTKLYGKILEWTGQTGDFSEKGLIYSFEGEFLNGVFFEIGRKHYEKSHNDNFFTFRVNPVDLLLGSKREKPFFAKKPYELASMLDHKYDKVRRENLIRKERRVVGGFTVTASGF